MHEFHVDHTGDQADDTSGAVGGVAGWVKKAFNTVTLLSTHPHSSFIGVLGGKREHETRFCLGRLVRERGT